MKQAFLFLIIAAMIASSFAFAAKPQASEGKQKTLSAKAEMKKEITKKKSSRKTASKEGAKKEEVKFKAVAKVSKKESVKKEVQAEAQIADSKWNEICQGLLDSSVKSTIKLEKSVRKKGKMTKSIVEEKIQNELMVVQLNAWVCAISNSEQKGAVAEQMFLQDYSKLVQGQKL